MKVHAVVVAAAQAASAAREVCLDEHDEAGTGARDRCSSGASRVGGARGLDPSLAPLPMPDQKNTFTNKLAVF